MITFFYFLRLAVRSLFRGGQRVLAAFLCITFGVMALVAMSMIANSIASAVVLSPAEVIGGDLSIGRQAEDTLRPQDVDQLKALQQSGQITGYTLIAYNRSVMFHAAGSGEMHFVSNGLGVEPGNYPLVGSLTIGDPGSANLPTQLQQVGDVVITRDVAGNDHIRVGDRIVLADLRVGVPVAGVVRGIASDTPNHQGDKIYYSLATAQQMANNQPVVNTAILTTPQTGAVVPTLESSGWAVGFEAGGSQKTANVWVIGLRGAGILGLLVGGVGIANTMQVLLRRRQREIAIWKTLGYRAAHLRLVFTLEAGLLGLAGSLLGAGLGVLISTGLLELFRRTSTMLYAWTYSPTPPLTGILVGTLSTVVFAAWAIVISSQASPLTLLRGEPVDVQRLAGCQPIALGLLLAGLFAILTCLAMGSILAGIGMLIFIAFGIALLGGFFAGLLWVCARLLPLGRIPLLRLALDSLRRRKVALVFAMMALFAGVVSMSLGMVVAQKSALASAGGAVGFQGYNLDILGSAGQENAIRQAIQAQQPEKLAVGYRAALAGLRAVGGKPITATDPILVGRSDPEDYIVSGAAWGSQPDGVYAYKWANLKAGSQVEVTFRDGSTHVLPVVGTYDINLRSNNLYPPTGLLMPAEAFTRLARPDDLIFFIQFAPNRLTRAAPALGAALPQATVVNLVDYAGRFMQSYQNAYILPMALAGLALLAGLLLVANSVSLAMLDRRYEIGVLKTVGYSRRQILSIFAVEYGLAGLLATGAGVLLIQGLLAIVAFGNHLAAGLLLLSFPSLALVAACSIGLTLLTVLGITWQPTRVSPVVVLNEGN